MSLLYIYNESKKIFKQQLSKQGKFLGINELLSLLAWQKT